VTRPAETPWRSRLLKVCATHRYRLAAAVVAVGAGLAVLFLATDLFPYHSSNHDEGVYLQQAAMLLEGRLFLTPGPEALREAFHPWFFVESERGFYPKYSPVPGAIFALGKLAGGYRLALSVIASLNIALVYAFVAAAFDRRTGLLAAILMASAPLFLITSSVFLPYAPTTALNLGFALAYVRAVRGADNRYAVVAGSLIGLAFFARPYTAVLFAAPFVVHALWRLHHGLLDRPQLLGRYGLIAALGTAFVGVTLWYNAFMTGDALLFPYEAFAPADGLGLGRRAILGYELEYTPALAVRANGLVFWAFASRWFTAGLIGTLAASVGLGATLIGITRTGLEPTRELSRPQLRVVLAGVLISVMAGNVLFWGNRNILGELALQGDGLISAFGPFYHFDLLVPLAAFAAHAMDVGWMGLRDRWPEASLGLRIAVVVLLVAALPVVGVAQADALTDPIDRNAAYTEKFEQAYAPFEPRSPPNALVFLPPTYGEWRNHPFHWLRNDPGFDGRTVYAISRHPAADFEVLSAYPDRDYYRYRYHGEWTPDPSRQVVPVFDRLSLREGSELTARTAVAVPDRIVSISVGLSNGETIRRWDFDGPIPRTLSLEWSVGSEGATVRHPNLDARDDGGAPLPIDGPAELALTITITEPGGGTLTYRVALRAKPTADGVAVLWPPAGSTCALVTDCGLEATYVPDRPDTRPDGIRMNTTLLELEE